MMSGVGAAAAQGLVAGLGSAILILILFGIYRLIKRLKSLPKNLSKKISSRKLADAEAEERLYDFVRQEFESGEIRSGLLTKAEATANSTEKAAIRAKYIQLRFEQLETQGLLQQHEPTEVKESAPEETFQKIKMVENTGTENSAQVAECPTQEPNNSRNWATGEAIGLTLLVFVVFFIIILVIFFSQFQ